MTDRAVLKWAVPVDDHPHHVGGGEVVHVACQYPQDPATVMVWTVEPRNGGAALPPRAVQVYGTGQPLPYFAEHLGSVVTAEGELVWHLFCLPGPNPTDVPEPDQHEETR